MWFNETVVAARRARRHSEWKWRKTHAETDHQAYIQSQYGVAEAIIQAKTEYFNDQLSNCNSRDMFKIVHKLLSNNQRQLPCSASPFPLPMIFVISCKQSRSYLL